MLDPLSVYIPEDRRQASAHGEELPERMLGAALYADISGFTPLTEALVKHHGQQRGAEELTRHLDQVYNALIEELHRYRGSVVVYSGDAITCWFDGDDGRRAVAAALGMQNALKQAAVIPFQSGEWVSLEVKVAVVLGEALRLLVGDPSTHVFDVMGGSVADRLAIAAQVVQPGEVVVDSGVIRNLAGLLIAGEVRRAAEGNEAFIVVTDLQTRVDPSPWPDLPPDSLTEEQIRPWVLPALYERMRQGHGQFLTELRPTMALFLHFGGIDYEHDPDAGKLLDAYIRWVQSVLARYEGVLLLVILGEKGNYLYATFGAPVVHEDDARRAVAAAYELQVPPRLLSFIPPVSIGLSRGTNRTGPIGSTDRRMYSVFGDEVNVAARLMEAAAPGEILATDRVLQRVADQFETEELPPLKIKGKSQPVPVYRITGAIHKAHQTSHGMLVGRAGERMQLDDLTRALIEGGSHVLFIEGEAGIGKSRLIGNWLNESDTREIRTLMGTGDAIEQATPYHAWRAVFTQLFQWDTLPEDREARRMMVLEKLDSLGLTARAPLLNMILPLELPDNGLTAEMSGKVRADNTREVLVALLQQSASTQPLRIVIEDAHWMDSASWALALAVMRQVKPLLLVLSTRPHPGDAPSDYQALFERPETLHLRLEALHSSDTIQLVCQRLGVDALPEQVAALILEKAEGHPFFSEELAYALRDSGVLQIVDRQAQIAPGVDFKSLNLPDTVDGVVTSRIDLLTPGQQLTVKVASVIGRIFSYRVLEDIHPVVTDRSRLAEYLERLQNLDVTPLATPPPDLSYMFKHIITQEVAYNLLLFSQRRQLHRAVAEWHERAFAHDLSPFYPLLAHHWLSASESDSEDAATLKAIEYLEKAGDAALRSYANREAADYFSKLLGIVNPRNSKSFGVSSLRMAQWEHQLGEAYNRLGYMVECEQHFTRSLLYLDWPLPKTMGRVAMALAGQIARQAWIRIRRNGASSHRQFTDEELEARRLACKIYERLGLLYFLKNKPGLEAFYCPLASLNLAEEIGPSPELAIAYSYVAGGAGLVPAHGLARLYERLSLTTAEQVNNPLITARVLMATSVYSAGTGRFEETDQRLRRAIASFEQGGVWEWWGVCVEMLTRVAYYQGRFQHAATLATRLYDLTKQQGDILQQSWALSSRMEALLMLGEHEDILNLAGEMEDLATQSHETGSLQKSLGVSAHVHLQRGEWTSAEERARQLLTIISSESPTSFGLLTVYTAAAEVYLRLWELQALPDVESLKQQATLACKLLVRYAKVLPIGECARLRTSGLLAWLSGHRSQAHNLWNQSLARAKELHMPLEEALAAYELGRHLPEGDPLRQVYLERSRELFRQLGAGYYLARMQDALPINGSGNA